MYETCRIYGRCGSRKKLIQTDGDLQLIHFYLQKGFDWDRLARYLDIIRDNSVLEVYFDNKYAMSARMNDFKEGTFGFAETFGEAVIESLEYMALER